MMKKFSLILPGAIALLMAATPFAVQARPVGLLAQQTQQQPKRDRANKLNLTDAQKQQAKAIRDQVRDGILRDVLTQAQRDQYNAAKQRGEKVSWRSMNLTNPQRTEIRTRMQAGKERITREVLTQEQRDLMQQRRSQRQQRGVRPGA